MGKLLEMLLSDYFRCRAVSRSWLATIDRAIASKTSLPSQLPCLMFRSGAEEEDHCFLSLSENHKVYKYSSPAYDMKNLECVGSTEGWLIMVDHGGTSVANFFLNLISGARVMLPPQTTIPCIGDDNKQTSFFSRVITSSAPTNPNSCLVAAVHSHCRDKSWTLIKVVGYRDIIVHDIEIIDGNLYAITADSDNAKHMSLYVFNINLDYAINEDCHRHTYEAQRLVFVLSPDHKSGIGRVMTKEQDGVYELTRSYIRYYLFKDSASSELFMIFVHEGSSPPASSEDLHDWVLYIYNFVVPPTPLVDPPTAVFRVYKLEKNSNFPRWVEVFDIGNRILFLSKTTRLFIPIITNQDGDLPHDKARLGGNCIYFAFGISKKEGEDVGVFSLTDNSIKHYTISGDRSPSRRAPPAWFTLNI